MSDEFNDTIWSLINPSDPGDDEARQKRLDRIVSLYYRPMRAFLRRFLSENYADDVLHEFVIRKLQHNFFERQWAPNSRFRNFLKVALRNFAYDQLRADGTGRFQALETPGADAELERQAHEAARSFDASWSQGLLKAAVEAYRESCQQHAGDPAAEDGRPDRLQDWQIFLIRFLRPAITRQSPPTYAEIGASCGLSEGAVANRIRSVRESFTGILEAHLRQHIDFGESLDDVMAQVCGLLAMNAGSGIELPAEDRSVEVTGRDLSLMLASISDSDAGEGGQSAAHLLELTVVAFADDAPTESIPDEWRHRVLQSVFDCHSERVPPVSLLQTLKDISRERATHARSVYAVLYHACLAAGWALHNTNLSSLSVEKQRLAFRRHLIKAALPAQLAELFLQAHHAASSCGSNAC